MRSSGRIFSVYSWREPRALAGTGSKLVSTMKCVSERMAFFAIDIKIETSQIYGSKSYPSSKNSPDTPAKASRAVAAPSYHRLHED